jgi:hypothetical protein
MVLVLTKPLRRKAKVIAKEVGFPILIKASLVVEEKECVW